MNQGAPAVGRGESDDAGKFVRLAKRALERLQIFDPDTFDHIRMMLDLAGVRMGVAVKSIDANPRPGRFEFRTQRAIEQCGFEYTAYVEADQELLLEKLEKHRHCGEW